MKEALAPLAHALIPGEPNLGPWCLLASDISL